MKKILCLLIVLAMALSITSCFEKTIKLEEHEWRLIYSYSNDTERYPHLCGVEGAPKFEGGIDVDMTLTADDGVLKLENRKTGEVFWGEYSELAEGDNFANVYDLEVTFDGITGYGAFSETELRDWNTENTGFDGSKYGKYAFSIDLDDSCELLFISINKK